MKRLISVSAACVFILALLASFLPTHVSGTNQYTIDEPYEYPITPDDPEWLELDSNVDKIRACEVPDSLIYQMTTDALLETVVSHPLINNIFAFSTPNAGVAILSNTYDMGLDELLSRDDLEESLIKKYAPMEVYSFVLPEDITYDKFASDYSEEINDILLMDVLEVLAAQIDLSSGGRAVSLLDIIEEKSLAKSKNSSIYGSSAFTYYKTISGSWGPCPDHIH